LKPLTAKVAKKSRKERKEKPKKRNDEDAPVPMLPSHYSSPVVILL
jgi:hypothetical protein